MGGRQSDVNMPLAMMHLHVALVIALGHNFRVSAQTANTNPAFTNIAPCGCDLTANQLDNNCCCDEEYDATAYGNMFACIQGPFGGNFSTQNDELCSAVLSFTPDWFPLLCIQTLNSPSLGLYFYPSATSGSPTLNSYDRTVSTFPTSSTLQSGSTLNAQHSDFHDSVLRFPQISAGGNCARQSPVHYLHDTFASCDVTVLDAVSCSAGTILDAAYYTSMTAVGNQALGTISYQCAGTNNGAYVKRNSGIGGTENNAASTSCNYTTPSVSDDTCQNAVAGVSYSFTWNAGNISGFDIVVTLVNMNFTDLSSVATSSGPDFVLAQQFSVSFVVNETDQTEIQYSGFPGYEYGLPVISGSGSSNASISVNRTSRLLVWKAGTTGACTDTEFPKFGFDEISGCFVNTESDCTKLRADIEATQLRLLEADKVARFGNPGDSDIDTDWIDVISRMTAFRQVKLNSCRTPIAGLSCPPAGRTLKRPPTSTSSSSYDDAIAGQCEGIPSRVVVEFLWSKSGETNGTAVREIVSAYVRFERETWTLRCDGTGSCDQRVIYSEVAFTEIPPEEATPQTSYDINRNDTCQKDAACWPELLLPLQPEFYYLYSTAVAFQLRSYNYAWAFFVTFFSIAAALIPAHWSTVGKYLKQVLPI